jgi:hypothetical protein
MCNIWVCSSGLWGWASVLSLQWRHRMHWSLHGLWGSMDPPPAKMLSICNTTKFPPQPANTTTNPLTRVGTSANRKSVLHFYNCPSVSKGMGARAPVDNKIWGWSSPSFKMASHLHATCVHPPKEFRSLLNYLWCLVQWNCCCTVLFREWWQGKESVHVQYRCILKRYFPPEVSWTYRANCISKSEQFCKWNNTACTCLGLAFSTQPDSLETHPCGVHGVCSFYCSCWYLFNYVPVGRHVGWFQSWVITRKAALNICVCIFEHVGA